MTTTEFEIGNADDPEVARTVADIERVPQIIPELDNIRGQMSAVDGGGDDSSSGGGIVDSIKDALGMSDGGKKGEREKLEAAERLTQEYADMPQDHLGKKGKWNWVRISYLG